jgi:rod shape-determining protein MreD
MRRLILYFILFWLGLVVQFSWVRYFAPFGVAPNLILVLIMFIGLTRGAFAGQLMGFLWGVAWDILALDLFGSHALLFTVLGFGAGVLSHKWNESKIISQVVITGLASMGFWLGMAAVYAVFAPAEYAFKLNVIIALQPLYNMLIAPAVFFLGNALIDHFQIDTDEF